MEKDALNFLNCRVVKIIRQSSAVMNDLPADLVYKVTCLNCLWSNVRDTENCLLRQSLKGTGKQRPKDWKSYMVT